VRVGGVQDIDRLTRVWLSSGCLDAELDRERLDPITDLVADTADGVDGLSGRVVEVPVEVSLSGEVGADIAATHGDDHAGRLRVGWCEDLRFLVSDIDADFRHDLDRDGVDLVGGCGSGGADLDLIASELAEESGGHLRAAGVVDADE